MGLEYARQLAERGYDLMLVSNREEELAEARAGLAAAYPVQVTARFQDLAQPYAADRLFQWCTGERGNTLRVDNIWLEYPDN